MKTVLAIGAHPDDIEFGCAGYLQKFDHRHNVVMTWGEEGGNQREKETFESSSCLKANLSQYWLTDTDITLSRAISILEAEITNINPDIVLTMSPIDTHQDHRTVYEATMVATRRTPCTVLSYMTPSSIQKFTPNWFVSLTEEELDNKLKALACHKSQQHHQYLSEEYIISMARYWAMVTRSNAEYVEPYSLIKHWIKEK